MCHSNKTPTEVLTAELRGCCNGYIGAPALAAQCVAALRASGWIIVRKGAIGEAQREAVRQWEEDNADKRTEDYRECVKLADIAEARYGPSEFPLQRAA